MKKSIKIAIIILLPFILFAFSNYYSLKIKDKKDKFISIEKAIKNDIVSAKITSTGTYSGAAINIEIENLTPIDTIIRFEAGRRLICEDTSKQDILIVKQIDLILAANESKRVNIFGFCCQAHNGAPKLDSKFDVGYMEDSTFIKLANFLTKYNYPTNVMQNAVWVLSDNNSLSSIPKNNSEDKKTKKKMKNLFQFLAALKGIKFVYPWYTLQYKNDTSRVFSNRPNRMSAEIEYYLAHQCNVDLVIKNKQNIVVRKLFTNKPYHRGTYTYNLDINVGKLPKGKYYLRLYADNQLKMEKEFEL